MSKKISLINLRNLIVFLLLFVLISLLIFVNIDNNRINNKIQSPILYDYSFDNLDKCKISQNELLKKIDNNYEISYLDIPLFPEVENIRCLGKVKNIIIN